MTKTLAKAIGVLALSACFATAANASTWTARQVISAGGDAPPTPAAAPEIDPASALGGLTLLLGGLAVVRGRRVKK